MRTKSFENIDNARTLMIYQQQGSTDKGELTSKCFCTPKIEDEIFLL